jgi:mersacidin/lichenicidin family type 2 lantibiotic
MANEEIIKAWKDEDSDETKEMPENPAGDVELTDEDLDDVSGGLAGSSCGWSSCNGAALSAD